MRMDEYLSQKDNNTADVPVFPFSALILLVGKGWVGVDLLVVTMFSPCMC